MKAIFELPDGKQYAIEVPQGTTPEQAESIFRQSPAYKVANDEISSGARNFAQDMSLPQQLTAGMGAGLSRMARGIGQGFRIIDQNTVDAENSIDKPLLNTTGGAIGNAVGTVIPSLPTMLIPGANSVVGAGIIGGLQGLIEPTSTGESAAKNTALGMLGGMAGQKLGQLLGQKLAARAIDKSDEIAAAKSANSLKDETLRLGQQLGYGIPQSEVNPTWLSNRLKSIAGKAATDQQFSKQNQEVTDSILRKVAGLSPDEALDAATLAAKRESVATPYETIEKMRSVNWSPEYYAALDKIEKQYGKGQLGIKTLSNPDIQGLIESLKRGSFTGPEVNEAIKSLREAGHGNLYALGAKPSEKSLGEAQLAASKALEDLIDQNLAYNGQKAVIAELRDARQKIAILHDIENSINPGNGEGSAAYFARQLKKGKPLSGDLETIGRMANSYARFMRDGSKVPTPGVSKLESMGAAMLGAEGVAGLGPTGVLAAGLPLMSAPVRALITSRPYQKAFVKPQYGDPQLIEKLANALYSQGGRAVLRNSTASGAYLVPYLLQQKALE